MSKLLKEHSETLAKALIGAITLQNVQVSLDADGELRVGTDGVFVMPTRGVSALFTLDVLSSEFWIALSGCFGRHYQVRLNHMEVIQRFNLPRKYNKQMDEIFRRAKEGTLERNLRKDVSTFARALNLGDISNE